ncbi:synaptobrevin-like protein YKT6 [Pancytospora epiphaga]|nr:synaptobrevin-like protein YKT6 [Pancytospora epiphaga]
MPAYAIIKLDTNDFRITKEKYNLESFSIFARGTIKNVIRVLVREVAERTNRDKKIMEIREKLDDKAEIKVITQKREGTRLVVMVDGKYDSEIARQLLQVAFENEDYDKLIKDYKNWEDKDILKKIEDELNQCNVIVVNGLSQILERGENLSDLVEKSENLSSQTKMLFKTAKKKNSCC